MAESVHDDVVLGEGDEGRRAAVTRGVARRGIQLAISWVLLALALFLPAGRVDWWQAWAYLGVFVGVIAFNALFVLRGDSELIAERADTNENAKDWDGPVRMALTVLTFLTLVTAGLDVRFGWSHVPAGWWVGGLLVVVAGNGLVSWGMSANRFLSRVVRLQGDRGQQVCSTGPYRFVRHPGYSGMIVYSLATAIGLGSWWALVPTALSAVAFVIRTVLEDRALRQELPGYSEYAQGVRYRLVPGLW